MRILLLIGALLMTAAAHAQTPAGESKDAQRWALTIHGGAGVIERKSLTPEKDAEIRTALARALDAGSAVLAAGGEATDAITATITVLEDDPNFNAGRGAVFTWDGTNEMDAAIMKGETLEAGAVTGVSATKNPVLLARKVMEDSGFVFLSGKGADQFSREEGLAQEDPSYFATPERRRQLDEMKARVKSGEQLSSFDIDMKYGTVGAVALDSLGHVAAATSTGGLTGKRWGRIGDSPIIGAGTYADDRSCAISATGAGEYFIRLGVAHEICARLRFAAVAKAAELQSEVPLGPDGAPKHVVTPADIKLADDEVQDIVAGVIDELGELGGTGGVIYATPGAIRAGASTRRECIAARRPAMAKSWWRFTGTRNSGTLRHPC